MRRTFRFLAAASMAALPAVAGAQAVEFAGSTLGCFYQLAGGPAAPGSMPCALSTFSNFGSLTFTQGAFDLFADPAGTGGISEGGIGSSAGPVIPGLTQDLGTVAATGAFTAPSPANPLFLRLRISFTTPTHTTDVNANGNPSLNVFDVDYRVTGNTSAPNQGGVNFTPVGGLIGPQGAVFDAFNGLDRQYNFYTGAFVGVVQGGAGASGVINFHTLDSRSVTAGSSATLTSFFQIESQVVPEPATVTLMATGVLALMGAGYFRRRNNA